MIRRGTTVRLTKFKALSVTVCLYLMGISPSFSPDIPKAQSAIEIRCGTFDETVVTEIIPGFFGRYYYVADTSIPENPSQSIALITSQGKQTIFYPPNFPLGVTAPRVSPDGRKIAFRPSVRGDNRSLAVWDLTTNEVVTFALSQGIADYVRNIETYYEDGVRKDRDSFVLHRNKLIWHSPSELWIQYFEKRLYPVRVSERLQLSVLENPLQIVSANSMDAINSAVNSNIPLTDIDAPYQATFTAPTQEYDMVVQTSPTPVVAGMGGHDIQIYDRQSNMMVFSGQSSSETQIMPDVFWFPDGSYIVYVEQMQAGHPKLVLLDAQQGFIQDNRLNNALEAQFGSSRSAPTLGKPVILAPDGVTLGFGYVSPQNERYVIRYNTHTGETIALCDEPAGTDDIYWFWSPSSRFIAYWYGEHVKVYDFETGNRYLMPGFGFAGWIEE